MDNNIIHHIKTFFKGKDVMFNEFFSIERKRIGERNAITVKIPGRYSLEDTLLCGQCFRYELTEKRKDYTEYMTVIKDLVVTVGQKKEGELIFYDVTEEEFNSIIRPYFDLDTDYEAIKEDIVSHTDSPFLIEAAKESSGIAILRQDPWETLCSFIISQNNNIPRIRKIIREISCEDGVNIALQNKLSKCPIDKEGAPPCEEKCKKCGRCFTFPSAEDIVKYPERLLASKPGFRYKYILDAAKRVLEGTTDLAAIAEANSYDVTVSELTKILGVGLKVASCTALFGFHNLDAFPIDVWMKRAIDTYFNGSLDHTSLGRYAGVAQQYIFHHIRNQLQESK